MVDKKLMGKRSRAAGQRFEKRVRADLEKKGWVVDKWSNNVELWIKTKKPEVEVEERKYETKVKITTFDTIVGKLVAAKNKFLGPGRPMMLGAGFPDFIAFRELRNRENIENLFKDFCYKISGLTGEEIKLSEEEIYRAKLIIRMKEFEVISVEAKMNGYLDKEEKAKCGWLLDNNIFSKILIAKKGKKRGEIIYEEFKNKSL